MTFSTKGAKFCQFRDKNIAEFHKFARSAEIFHVFEPGIRIFLLMLLIQDKTMLLNFIHLHEALNFLKLFFDNEINNHLVCAKCKWLVSELLFTTLPLIFSHKRRSNTVIYIIRAQRDHFSCF